MEGQATDSTAENVLRECLAKARVESDSKDKSLAVTRCNGAPILRGVESNAKINHNRIT